jgi:hypothetical protein
VRMGSSLNPFHPKVRWAIKVKVRARFWLETTLASLCGSLSVLTVFWRDWVEALTGFNPDGNNGSFEWAIIAGLLLFCVAAGVAARVERLRPRTAAAEPSG